MSRPRTPPDMAFFGPDRPAPGPHRLLLRLDRLGIELAGLDSGLADRLQRRYAPFCDGVGSAARPRAGVLQLRVGREDREHFIEPPDRPERNPVLLACDGARVRYLGYRVAGWFEPEGARGALLLSRGDYEPAERAIDNFLLAAIAWCAATRGGALVHAAGAVLEGRGYLFFGPSGAGKSTVASCNRRARFVGDDVALVLPDRRGRPCLVGAPFRGTHGGPPVAESVPLAAGFRLVQERHHEVREVDRVRVVGELVGSLPFVADSFGVRPDVWERVQRGFASTPLAHLHFRRDDGYWDAVLAWVPA